MYLGLFGCVFEQLLNRMACLDCLNSQYRMHFGITLAYSCRMPREWGLFPQVLYLCPFLCANIQPLKESSISTSEVHKHPNPTITQLNGENKIYQKHACIQLYCKQKEEEKKTISLLLCPGLSSFLTLLSALRSKLSFPASPATLQHLLASILFFPSRTIVRNICIGKGEGWTHFQ